MTSIPSTGFEQAEELAEADAAFVLGLAGRTVLGDCCGIVVHGDHLSPSWRALDGGDTVWQRAYDVSNGPELIEAYTEVLDRLVDGYDTNGESLMWADGCLWLIGADCECHA